MEDIYKFEESCWTIGFFCTKCGHEYESYFNIVRGDNCRGCGAQSNYTVKLYRDKRVYPWWCFWKTKTERIYKELKV